MNYVIAPLSTVIICICGLSGWLGASGRIQYGIVCMNTGWLLRLCIYNWVLDKMETIPSGQWQSEGNWWVQCPRTYYNIQRRVRREEEQQQQLPCRLSGGIILEWLINWFITAGRKKFFEWPPAMERDCEVYNLTKLWTIRDNKNRLNENRDWIQCNNNN